MTKTASLHLFHKAVSLVVLPLLLAVAACSADKERVRIEGKYKNLESAEFYIFSEGAAFNGIDTVHIEEGKFTYECAISEPQVLTLLYPNFSRTYVIAEPGTTVKLSANAERLEETDISGTDANERFCAFRLKNLSMPQGDLHLAAAQYIRDNARTLDALAAFLQYFTTQEQSSPREMLDLLDVLRRGMPGNRDVRQLEAIWRPRLTTGVGQKLPEFSGTALDGTAIDSKDYRGEPLLVLFIASWQPESREAIRQLKRLGRAFPGKFRSLVVSLDTNPKGCRDMLKRDTLNVPAVCDGLSFNSPLADKLGARLIPGNLLVGRDGKIAARDLRDKELENELARLVGA